jgi:hypothetical protein
MKSYKTVNGTSFHEETPDKVCQILSDAINTRRRLKLTFGDTETGRSWNEEHDTRGRIGRSTGTNKIPLLIHNTRSIGGGAILDQCIIKIIDTATGQILYRHEMYQEQEFKITPSDMKEYTHNVLINGALYSRHRSERSAKILVSKLK